jgi:hypothetical protein
MRQKASAVPDRMATAAEREVTDFMVEKRVLMLRGGSSGPYFFAGWGYL